MQKMRKGQQIIITRGDGSEELLWGPDG